MSITDLIEDFREEARSLVARSRDIENIADLLEDKLSSEDALVSLDEAEHIESGYDNDLTSIRDIIERLKEHAEKTGDSWADAVS